MSPRRSSYQNQKRPRLNFSVFRMYTQYFSEGLDSVKFSGQIAGFKSPGWEPSAATQVQNQNSQTEILRKRVANILLLIFVFIIDKYLSQAKREAEEQRLCAELEDLHNGR